jgi:hypothetical protein
MELSPASETQNMPRLFRTLAGCSSTGRKGASRAQQGSLDTSGHASFHRAGLAQRRRQRARQREALHRRRHHRDHPCSVATRSSGPLQPWLSGLARRHRYAPFVHSAQMPLSSREGNLVSNELDKRPPSRAHGPRNRGSAASHDVAATLPSCSAHRGSSTMSPRQQMPTFCGRTTRAWASWLQTCRRTTRA